MFPGDMTPEGMKHILEEQRGVEKRFTVFSASFAREHPSWNKQTGGQPSLKDLLGRYGLSVLVAPHHGLESCYSPELYSAIKGGKPQIVIISERRHCNDNDGSLHPNYQCDKGASGLNVEVEGAVEKRRSISTQSGHILITFNGTGVPRVYADRDQDKLLAKLGN